MTHENDILTTYDLGTSNKREYALVITACCEGGFDIILKSTSVLSSEDVEYFVVATGKQPHFIDAVKDCNVYIDMYAFGYTNGFRRAEEMHLA